MNWSFQLYSARNFQPWEGVLETLGKVGYTQVEGFGGVYDDPKAFRAELDKNGLAMPTGHFSIDALENDFDGVRKIADTLGITLLICPFLMPDQRPSDAAVEIVEPMGSDTLVWTKLGGQNFSFRVEAEKALRNGEPIRIGFDPARASLFDSQSGNRM